MIDAVNAEGAVVVVGERSLSIMAISWVQETRQEVLELQRPGLRCLADFEVIDSESLGKKLPFDALYIYTAE